MRELSTRQKRFIEAFAGNGTAAAIAAGYSEKYADRIAAQLMKNPRIADAIRAREAERNAPHIADREERQRFFTATMRDEKKTTRDRLRAAELLGKSEGDFIERLEASVSPLQSIEIVYADVLQRADGTNIDPDESPAEYAGAWLKKFFREHGAPGELEKLEKALSGIAQNAPGP